MAREGKEIHMHAEVSCLGSNLQLTFARATSVCLAGSVCACVRERGILVC